MLLFGVGYVALKQVKKETTTPSATQMDDSLNSPEPTNEKVIDIKASFAIFTNGTFRIFTDKRYHNLSPEVYIESQNPNVIKVQSPDVTWADFFETLPMELTDECLTTGTGQKFCNGEGGNLSFYINGASLENALNQEIKHSDKLLVSFGDPSESEIQNQLSQIPEAE